MTIRQISIFLENKTGGINKILTLLGEHKINIIALTVADTSNYGLVRLIVSDPDKAHDKLKENNFSIHIHEVLSLEMAGTPGSLSQVLDLFTEANIAIEYVYAFSFGSKSIVVFQTNNHEESCKIIEANGLKTISEIALK